MDSEVDGAIKTQRISCWGEERVQGFVAGIISKMSRD